MSASDGDKTSIPNALPTTKHAYCPEYRFWIAVTDFLIIAWVVFLQVKAVNKTKKVEAEASKPDPGPGEFDLLSEIAAALTSKRLQMSKNGLH
ncbi:MAG: MscL family protein [Paracoccaceae bacterium]